MSDYVIPRPASGDIVRLILEDHRLFEDLLRGMRTVGLHRDAARRAFAELHVAHAVAEEEVALPTLQRRRAITRHEQHHGEEEHAEAHVELLDAGCASLPQLRRIVGQAEDEGLLDSDDTGQ
ncbi:hypothetical protein GCM10022199_24780 [Marihabitans asiaticum]|uniref:Hemerythrin HHE cation binding domain-containing protein n=1 Tax=Marihabitans asiaticum TaxID=415218 RepID=A0A560W9L8_9MICO|nr:hypothetical protein [Marihabitans asiaticum]TWD14302.1 hypothetical protein FB557_1710 [Marihabitans asiaticum]